MTDTSWYRDAICAQTDPNAWVADISHPAQTAVLKKICGNCPVQNACLNFALTEQIHYGIWGGTTPTERARLRKQATR